MITPPDAKGITPAVYATAWDRMRAVAERGEKEAAGSMRRGVVAPLHGAALAAGLLEEAWSLSRPEAPSLRARVTRELARSLRTELEALAGAVEGPHPLDAGLEGALRAADVANLAASSLDELSEGNARTAAAAAHLAAGAARAICALVGGAGPGGERAEYALKDARGALWRAGLAARQADEFLEGTS